MKINVDAVVSNTQTGINVMIRNCVGTIKAAMVQPLFYRASVLAMEAQATIQGIFLDIKCGFLSYVVESDSQFICHEVYMHRVDLFLVENFVKAI